MSLAPHRVDVFLSDLPWIRSCLSLQRCRELGKPIRQGTLVALALEFRAQRMRDRLCHIGLAQPGEFPRQFANFTIADADAHDSSSIYDSLTYVHTRPLSHQWLSRGTPMVWARRWY